MNTRTDIRTRIKAGKTRTMKTRMRMKARTRMKRWETRMKARTEDEEIGDKEDYPPCRQHRHHPIPPSSTPCQQCRHAIPLPSSPGQLPNRPIAGPSPPSPLSNRDSSIRSGIRRSVIHQPPDRISTCPIRHPSRKAMPGIRPNIIYNNNQILFHPLIQSSYFEPDPMDEDMRTFHSENIMAKTIRKWPMIYRATQLISSPSLSN